MNSKKIKIMVKNSDYYIYGKHAAIAAMQNPNRTILSLFCSKEFLQENHAIVSKYKYKISTNQEIAQLLPRGSVHQGIALLVKPITLNHIQEVDLSDPLSKVVILDQITDEHNVGAIMRSASAFGIRAIIAAYDGSPEESGVMAKIASGGLEKVPFIRVVNIRSTIDALKKIGFWVIGLDGGGGENVSTKLLSGKAAIVLGSEGYGMRRLTKENCDLVLRIPIKEGSESINVSNAAAIAFYLAASSDN
jgi:23S rRNA (guanosine2251-2'-O)-methyltransferase